MIYSKHRLKQLFDDTSKLPSSKFYELIDSIWYNIKIVGNANANAGIINLNAGWQWVTIPTQPDLNYNPVCYTYDAADNNVGNKVAYSTLEVARFSIWVNKACTLRWNIIRHS